jgi:hypothetical protein
LLIILVRLAAFHRQAILLADNRNLLGGKSGDCYGDTIRVGAGPRAMS